MHFPRRRNNSKMPSRKYAAYFPSKHSAFMTSSSFEKRVSSELFFNGLNKQKYDRAGSRLCDGCFGFRPSFGSSRWIVESHCHTAISQFLSVIALSWWTQFSVSFSVFRLAFIVYDSRFNRYIAFQNTYCDHRFFRGNRLYFFGTSDSRCSGSSNLVDGKE